MRPASLGRSTGDNGYANEKEKQRKYSISIPRAACGTLVHGGRPSRRRCVVVGRLGSEGLIGPFGARGSGLWKTAGLDLRPAGKSGLIILSLGGGRASCYSIESSTRLMIVSRTWRTGLLIRDLVCALEPCYLSGICRRGIM